MNKDEIITLVKDWRVALLIILVVASLIAIYPHFEDGEFTTNLQYGLDLQKGAWLQLEFKSEVVGFQTDKPVDEFIASLKNQTDAEIFLVGDKAGDQETLYAGGTDTDIRKSRRKDHIIPAGSHEGYRR